MVRSEGNENQEQAGNTQEMEAALQSIGKPIEAVLDESGTVVTLIPCLEEENSVSKSGGGCILRSIPHHVMHETPPSSAESYPTAIDVSRSFYQTREDDKQVDESFIFYLHLDSFEYFLNAVLFVSFLELSYSFLSRVFLRHA